MSETTDKKELDSPQKSPTKENSPTKKENEQTENKDPQNTNIENNDSMAHPDKKGLVL